MRQDYLAIVRIGGGSSHGRGPTIEKAVDRCKMAVRDWDHLFNVYNTPIKAAIYDVTGHQKVYWADDGTFADGTNERIPVEELVEFTLTKRRKRA